MIISIKQYVKRVFINLSANIFDINKAFLNFMIISVLIWMITIYNSWDKEVK